MVLNFIDFFLQAWVTISPSPWMFPIWLDAFLTFNFNEIKVFFNQDGGGDDFEDVFAYWINTENYKVDYLAYSYQDPGEDLDFRFRVAQNERFVNSIRFVDYQNYKSEVSGTTLFDLDSLYDAGQLKLLSTIENENISVD